MMFEDLYECENGYVYIN